ncbi:hypothetical protein ACFZAV_45530 [Streptomyces sp. NPDC008343]|uniref:hypothetical protein n=1 Tax=Streptomyces sp. NPDC008343 TaxID=3364828 RepID=UPI0036E1341B
MSSRTGRIKSEVNDLKHAEHLLKDEVIHMSERSGMLRLGSVVGVVGALVTSAVLAGAGYASAADTDSHQHVELEIANDTNEPLSLDAKFSTDKDRGRIGSKDRNGTQALPESTFEAGKGAVLKYAVDFIGDTDWKEAIGYIYDFKNYFNIQAAAKNSTAKSQVTLAHEGRVYGEGEANKMAVTGDDGNNRGDFSFNVQQQANPSSGFTKKYRLSISKDSPGTSDPLQGSVTKLTGGAADKPVWKIRVSEHTKKFNHLPDDIEVPPISVMAGVIPGPAFSEVGKVVPTGKPKVDRSNNTVTFPESTFYWENPDGGPQYTHLQFHSGTTPGPLLDLTRAAGPAADVSQRDVTSVEASGATGLPVTSNGVAQEALKVKISASGGTVSPDHRPELASLYDNVYFRDDSGKLITGMYEDSAAGGYTSVSATKGGYVNAFQSMQSSDTTPERFYLSTTKKTAPVVRAYLSVTKKQQSPEVRVERADAAEAVDGSGRIGIKSSRGITNPDNGAFHHFNGEKPAAAILTRYAALPTVASLPIKSPFSGHFAVQNSDSVAILNHFKDLELVKNLQTQLVSGAGTYVVVPNLAV